MIIMVMSIKRNCKATSSLSEIKMGGGVSTAVLIFDVSGKGAPPAIGLYGPFMEPLEPHDTHVTYY